MTNDLVFVDPIEKPPCPECKGTGKIVLFTGIVDCDKCKSKEEDFVVYDFVVGSDAKPTADVRYIQMAGRAVRHTERGLSGLTGMVIPEEIQRKFYQLLCGARNYPHE